MVLSRHLGALWFLFLVLCAAPTQALELKVSESGRELVALDEEGGEQWRQRVAFVEAPKADAKPDEEPVKRPEVHYVVRGQDVFLCAKRHVMKLDATSGVVRWHDFLSDRCEGITEHDDEGISVRVAVIDAYGNHTGDAQIFAVSEHGIEQPNIVFHAFRGMAAYEYMNFALNVLDERVASDELSAEAFAHIVAHQDTQGPPTEAQRAELLAALDALEMHAARDVTNLGYLAQIARIWRALDDADANARTFERAFALDARYHPELTLFVSYTEPIGMARAVMFERAFEMALMEGLRQGYEPMANRSLVSAVMFLGSPARSAGDELWDNVHIRRSEEFMAMHTIPHIERVWRFTPRVEMSSSAYDALATYYESRAEESEAARWRARHLAASDSSAMGLPSDVMSDAGHFLYMFWTCGVVFWVLIALKLLRVAFNRVPEGTPRHVRYNVLNRLTRAELLGLFVIPVLMLASYSKSSRAVIIIGEMANAPITWDQGCFDCEEVREQLEHNLDLDAARFMLGYGAHKSGDFERARSHYEVIASRDVRARHNLGVLCAQRGDESCAKEAFSKLVDEPEIGQVARYNLDGTGESARIIDQRRAEAGPIVIPPDGRDRLALMEDYVSDLIPPASALTQGPVGGDIPGQDVLLSVWGLALQLLVLGSVLHALVWRPKQDEIIASKMGMPAWAVGALVPGASRHWGVFGALVCVMWATSCVAMAAYVFNDEVTTNVLAMIATPAFGKFFGIDTTLSTEAAKPWIMLARSWWIFLVVNLVFIAVMERLRPDPNGPFSGSKAI